MQGFQQYYILAVHLHNILLSFKKRRSNYYSLLKHKTQYSCEADCFKFSTSILSVCGVYTYDNKFKKKVKKIDNEILNKLQTCYFNTSFVFKCIHLCTQ